MQFHFIDASFAYTKNLTGQAVKKTRAEEMTQAVDQSLGDALTQLYVKKYFPAEAKKRMIVLVDNLKKAFEVRINKMNWIGDSTKTKAKEKLQAFIEKPVTRINGENTRRWRSKETPTLKTAYQPVKMSTAAMWRK